MRLGGLNIYVEGLAVHLAYQFRSPFRVWSDLSEKERKYWKSHAYDLLEYLKKQKATPVQDGNNINPPNPVDDRGVIA